MDSTPSPASLPVSAPLSGLDRAAAALPILCAVHCVVAPLLVGLLPTVAVAVRNPVIDVALLGITAALAGATLLRGVRAHGDARPPLLGLAGLGVLALGIAVLEEGSPAHLAASGGGAILLLLALLGDRRQRSRCCLPASATLPAQDGCPPHR